MLLTDLILADATIMGGLNPDITGITADSRLVKKGFVFVAMGGSKTDGVQFIASAIEAGAAAIVVVSPVAFPIAQVITDNPRLILSKMAARFYDRQPAVIAAVTGTNGKTSVAHFCRTLWRHLGKKSASIGTIGVIADENTPLDGASLTTPDPVNLHATLDRLAEQQVGYVALEASSHGLDQFRLDGVKLTAAAFTNLSRDHLDYHLTYENYLQAKMQLFARVLPPGGVAVLNADIPEYGVLKELCLQHGHRCVSYGWQGEDFRLLSAVPTVTGQQLVLLVQGKEYQVKLELVGEFQAMNLLCALGLVVACGAKVEEAVKELGQLPSVPGRMEKVPGASAEVAVFVDYAHTPDALEKALKALRPHTDARLLVMFGCGGDRDKGKRPQMGRIAAQLADRVVVTDDNPRTEDAAVIRSEVMVGCAEATEIGDRAAAIAYAISVMQPGDILLIAGKGHEKTQIMKEGAVPFDDVAIAAQQLKEQQL